MATNPESIWPILEDDTTSQSNPSEVKSVDEETESPPSTPVLLLPQRGAAGGPCCWRKAVHIVIVCLCLLLIWGGSILPIIFYFNPVSAPEDNPRHNISVVSIPLPVFPCTSSSCNSPLICNGKTGICSPQCTWDMLSPKEALALKVVDNTSIIINLTLFVVIFITWIRSSQLLRFPNIVPLYLTTLSAGIALLLGIGNGMGKKKAFCNSEYLQEARENPTTFCTVQGFMIQYMYTALVAWYLVYTTNLLLVFVLNRVRINQDPHRAHIICSIFCWTLPFIPEIVVMMSSEKYNVVNLRYCGPATVKMNFYSSVVLVVFAQVIGCTCLFAVVHKFVMERNSSLMNVEQAAKRRTVMNKVVFKLTMLMCVYSVTVALTFVTICIGLRNADLIKKCSEDYFKCLIFSPNCPKDYEKYTDHIGNIIATMTTALFSISTFFFLSMNEQSRALWSQWYNTVKKLCSNSERESFQSSNDKTKVSRVT